MLRSIAAIQLRQVYNQETDCRSVGRASAGASAAVRSTVCLTSFVRLCLGLIGVRRLGWRVLSQRAAECVTMFGDSLDVQRTVTVNSSVALMSVLTIHLSTIVWAYSDRRHYSA